MPESHPSKAFDNELQELHQSLLRMFATVRGQLSAVHKALQEGDAEVVKQLMNGDDKVDALEDTVDVLSLRFLTLRQPRAKDLRVVVAAQKIAVDLERLGDYCSGVARGLHVLVQPEGEPYRNHLSEMLKIAERMLELAYEAYTEESVRKAMQAWHLDDDLDELYSQLLGNLHRPAEGAPTGCDFDSLNCTLLLAARAAERMGDHVTNISEHIYFLILGEAFPRR